MRGPLPPSLSPHQPWDQVYVKDQKFGWLPATVLQITPEHHRALVRIDLPTNWEHSTVQYQPQSNLKTTSSTKNSFSYGNSSKISNVQINQRNKEERWVDLSDYHQYRMPFQNNTSSSNNNNNQNGGTMTTAYLARDMADLTHLHEAAILYQIKERFVLEHPYTRVGEIIVAVNPCQWIESLYSMSNQRMYAQNLIWSTEEESTTEEKKNDNPLTMGSTSFGSTYQRLGFEPHIYEVSSMAYRGLIVDDKDQTILVSGESGAGKTETVKIVLQHLSQLEQLAPPNTRIRSNTALYHEAKTARKTRASLRPNNQELVQLILEASPIFEAFGNAKTIRNNNSSRFGRVTRLRFAARDIYELQGSLSETYLLETSRVVLHAEGERNFHIFYQLLAAPSKVREQLLGPEWAHTSYQDFAILRHHSYDQWYDPKKQSVGGSDSLETNSTSDAVLWEKTLFALNVFQWQEETLKTLMCALGIVLRLGNLVFEACQEGRSIIASEEALVLLASSMGVSVHDIEQVLLFRTIQSGHEQLRVPHTPDQANDACDALSKSIYYKIFEYVVRQVNLQTYHTTATDGSDRIISLVDIFGFEKFEVNRFEQLCVNYTSEKLQQKYVHDNLRRLKSEYAEEGIALLIHPSVDNSHIVELFESPLGLIASLNEECIRPNGNDESFVFKIKKANKEIFHDNLHHKTEFGIVHFTGDTVIYDATKFVERNSDKLPEGLVSLAAKSTNTMIRGEFLALQKSYSDTTSLDRGRKKSVSISDKFRLQLQQLIKSMEGTQTRYIRCIKPNDNLRPHIIDQVKVLKQLRCAGLVAAIDLSRETYPNKLSFETVVSRFQFLLLSHQKTNMRDMELHDKATYVMSALYAPLIEKHHECLTMPYACGKTRIYFRAGALEIIETMRFEFFNKMAARIQFKVHQHLDYLHYRRFRSSIIKVQASSRGRTARRSFILKQRAAIKLENWCRAWIALHQYNRTQRLAIAFGNWSRMILQRRSYIRIINYVCTLQMWIRHRLSRKRYVSSVQRRSIAANAIGSWLLEHIAKAQEEENDAENSLAGYTTLDSHYLSVNSTKIKVEFTRSDSGGITNLQGDDETAVITEPGSDNIEVVVRRSLVDRLNSPTSDQPRVEALSEQILQLQTEMGKMTEDADQHMHEVAAEFEERLAEYECEVLELQQTVRRLENEKRLLQDEMVASKKNNRENVQKMQKTLKEANDLHKEYLNKITAIVESADEARKRETARLRRELETIKENRDSTIGALKEEIQALKQERRRSDNVDDLVKEAHRLAHKMETFCNPEYVMYVVEEAHKRDGDASSFVDRKISFKCRNITYRLEDLVRVLAAEQKEIAQNSSTLVLYDQEAEVQKLQNQLVRAYEEMEALKRDMNESNGYPTYHIAEFQNQGVMKFMNRY